MAREFVRLDAEVAAAVVQHFGGSPELAAREIGLSRQTFWRIRHGDVANLSPKNREKWDSYVKSEARNERMQRPEWLEGRRLRQDATKLEELRRSAEENHISTKVRNGTILDYLFENRLDPEDSEVYEEAFGYPRKMEE